MTTQTNTPPLVPAHSFQQRCVNWLIECFGIESTTKKPERIHRFTEEALELAQSAGCTKDEVLQLVDYVYSRPKGEFTQEVGGVATTLAVLCNAYGVNLEDAQEAGLVDAWSRLQAIREKRKLKPEIGPLPQ